MRIQQLFALLYMFSEAAIKGVLYKKVFLKISQIHRKTPVPESYS